MAILRVMVSPAMTRTGTRPIPVLVAVAIGAIVCAFGATVQAAHASARWRQCRDPYSAHRNPAKPLMLPKAPGSNPLTGARFFVDGPAHGEAAHGIDKLLGISPDRYKDGYSWARFKRSLDHGRLHRRLVHHPGLAWKVRMLERIASQPEPQRFSSFAFGGGPGAAWDMAIKIFCHNMKADPQSIPIITTYFLHPDIGRDCSPGHLNAVRPKFQRSINEMVAATARHPAVYLLELDATGSSTCFARHHDFGQYLVMYRYEVRKVSALPHTVVYVEAGYSDSDTPRYTAHALRRLGLRGVRGFFTNDTHENWTIREIRWAMKVSRQVHGAHFIVNTGENGRGPKKNPHPVTQGTNDLCNPPNRGIGPLPTTHTGFARVDAFLWTIVPGESDGHCNGAPNNGTYWPAYGIRMAARATSLLGPGLHSR
jgi:endoglucanase